MSSAFIHIREGKIQNPHTLRNLFIDLQEGKYMVEVKRSNKRSLQQNAWLHAILPEILQGLREAGYDGIRTTQDAKDVIKAMFFKKTQSNGIDEIPVIEGTSETSKEIFIERADAIIKWASEYLGIDVAPPSKQFEFFELWEQ